MLYMFMGGSNDLPEKRAMWDHIDSVAANTYGLRILAGDLNSRLAFEQTLGRNY